MRRRRLALIPLGAAAAACSEQSNFLRPAGDGAASIAALTWGLIILSTIVTVAVIALTLYAVQHRQEHVRTYDEEKDRGSIRWIVIGGAVVPAAILVALFIVTLGTLNALAPRSAEGPLVIELTGRQWWWQVAYVADDRPYARIVAANEIHIPTGVRVPVRLHAADVIHSFWVPALQGKIDLIPGRTTHTWLHAERPGVYHGTCAEYCGLQHARMALKVIAHEPAEFDAWLAREAAPARPDTATSEAAAHAAHGHGSMAGREVFMSAGCALCHTIRGTPARGNVGPDLTHIGSRRALAAGTVPNTRAHLAGWIANPQAIKPGARMPRMPLAPEDLHALVTYLSALH